MAGMGRLLVGNTIFAIRNKLLVIKMIASV